MLFQDQKFDVQQVLNYFQLKQQSHLAIYYEMEPEEAVSSRGIVEVAHENK
jgi:glucuronokinase